MDSKHLHIALATDNNYLKFAATLIVSLFESNKEFTQITIHLLANNISNQNINELYKYIPENRGILSIYDISNIKERLQVPIPDTISISAYSRLFLTTLLDISIEKIIYADVDAIIHASLFDVWQIDLKKNLLAGVIDTSSDYSKKAIQLPLEEPYINSGFLVINLKEWRKENIETKMLSFFNKHKGNVYHHDQGIINAVCCGRKLILPAKYNALTSYCIYSYEQLPDEISKYYTKEDLNEAKTNPIFIHFTQEMTTRPWIKGCKHPMKHLFFDIRSKTQWKNEPLEEENRKITVKLFSFIYYHMPFSIYHLLIKIKHLIKPSDI